MSVELTIGMPVYRDLGGPWATVDSLIHHHRAVLAAGVEVLLVDNAPDSPEGRELARWAKLSGIRYEPYSESEGPAGAKDAVFEHASGRVVACLDSHVLLLPGSIQALRSHFRERYVDHQHDLVSGPQIFDHGQVATHLDRLWGGGMLGRWALAWHGPRGSLIYPRELEGNRLEWLELRSQKPISVPDLSEITAAGWANHERRMLAAGWKYVGHRKASPAPVTVPAFGMGAFACLREHWPKFRAGATQSIEGFGGEEVMIHDAQWLAGGRVVCLPRFQWVHRYLHLDREKPYRREWYDRVRTYLLWGRRNQYDQKWWHAELHREFVSSGLLPEAEWRRLIADPEANRLHAARKNQRGPRREVELIARDNPIAVMAEADRRDPQRSEAARIVGTWAGKCSSVTDVSPTPRNAIAIAASGARRLHTWSTGPEADFARLHAAVPHQDALKRFDLDCGDGAAFDQVRPDAADCLVIEPGDRCPHLRSWLATNALQYSRYIIVVGSDKLGRRHNGQSYRFAADLQTWWQTARAEWHVLEATDANWGVCVFGRDRAEVPTSHQWPWDPGYGPGNEMHLLLESIGAKPEPGCSCHWRMAVMNRRGVVGCLATRTEIVGWIKEAADKWSWVKKVPAGLKLLNLGGLEAIADPIAWVVGEAIRRSSEIDRRRQRMLAAS